MTGWIKMSTGLRRHPNVVRIASFLDADRMRIVGGLHSVWCVFDEHSRAGRLDGYTPEALDEEIGWPGFSRAMETVGWIVVDDLGIEAPNYEEHNGPNAKRRAIDAGRKAAGRALSEDRPPGKRTPVRNLSASNADKLRSREEERRQEQKHSDADASGGSLPPASPSRDAKEVVFALGVPMLTAAGSSEKVARSFLAKQAKDHGDGRVADALRACASDRPVEPTAWLVQRLGRPMPVGMPDCPVDDIAALYSEVLPKLPPPMITDALRSRLRDRWRWLFTEPRVAGEPPRASNAEKALGWLRGLFEQASLCPEIVNDEAARRVNIVQGLDYIVGDAGIKRIGATIRSGRRVVAEAAS